LPRCPCHLRRHSRLPLHPCCLFVALYSPCHCLVLALLLPCTCLASPLPCRRLAVASPPLFARHCHHHVHVRSRRPTRTATATAIAIGIVGRYPYWCCCHHQRHSSCRRLCCLRCRCPDVSVGPDAPAAPPLPPSFVTDPTAVRLRLAMVTRQRRRWRQRR
jgi:hypothetical protein